MLKCHIINNKCRFINIFNYTLLSFTTVSVSLLNTISESYNKNTTISISSVADLFPLVYSPYATSEIIRVYYSKLGPLSFPSSLFCGSPSGLERQLILDSKLNVKAPLNCWKLTLPHRPVVYANTLARGRLHFLCIYNFIPRLRFFSVSEDISKTRTRSRCHGDHLMLPRVICC